MDGWMDGCCTFLSFFLRSEKTPLSLAGASLFNDLSVGNGP